MATYNDNIFSVECFGRKKLFYVIELWILNFSYARVPEVVMRMRQKWSIEGNAYMSFVLHIIQQVSLYK